MWRAWHALHHDRPTVLTGVVAPLGGLMLRPMPGRIPWTAIRAYAEHHGIGPDDMEVLVKLIGEMDGEFLAWSAEQARAAR